MFKFINLLDSSKAKLLFKIRFKKVYGHIRSDSLGTLVISNSNGLEKKITPNRASPVDMHVKSGP